MALCLLIEDDHGQNQILSAILGEAGYQVITATDGQSGISSCEQHRPELILLDLGLPDCDGLVLIPELLSRSPLSRIVVLTGDSSISSAVQALRAGARHYLLKPWESEELLVVIEREARAVDFAESRTRSEEDPGIFWGSDPAMNRIRAQVDRLSMHPLTPVLIHGATGTGKEMVARELHRLTAEAGPFVALNCAAVPAELLESELFGHERGAFTGANSRRRGLAELARGGTLFLDEIGEMALPLQAKLLRFLQDFSFRRVGAEQELSSRCRIAAATHRDLASLQEQGLFRSDLYYRLAVVALSIPPLRERLQDLLPLAHVILEHVAHGLGCRPKRLAHESEQAILDHSWKGNVRELRNRIERALVLCDDQVIRPADLDLPAAPGVVENAPFGDDSAQLRTLLEAEGWNVARAARRRGVPRHWLRYRMKKLGLNRPG